MVPSGNILCAKRPWKAIPGRGGLEGSENVLQLQKDLSKSRPRAQTLREPQCQTRLTHSLTHWTSDLHHQEGPSGALPGSFLSASEECSCKARDLKRFAQSPLRWEMEVKRQGSFQRLTKKSTPRLRGDNSGSLGKGNPIPVGVQWLCGLLVKTLSFNFRLDLNVTILGCKSWMNME